MLQGTIMARWDHIHDNDVVTVSPCALSCYEFAPELDDLPGKLTGREQSDYFGQGFALLE